MKSTGFENQNNGSWVWVCVHFNHFINVTINSHTIPNIIRFLVGCGELGILWHLVANLGAITHHTDNLGPITCHGKPLCHMLPCSPHFELFYELYTSIRDKEYFLLKWRHVPCDMTSSTCIIPSLSILKIWRCGGVESPVDPTMTTCG